MCLFFFIGCSQNDTERTPVAVGETMWSYSFSASSAQSVFSEPSGALSSSNSSVVVQSASSLSQNNTQISASSLFSSQTYSSISSWIYTDSGFCADRCDNSVPAEPQIYSWVATGNITTYGSIVDPTPSRGGACNFGNTEIMQFAAINVHIIPGDNQGQWQGGAICGQCVEIRARTNHGWKTTIVRIVDKCPDDNCGIDLGGTATAEIMGDTPGRYSGEWRFVDCPESPLISDGNPHIYVKDGSSVWWSLIQVRNPPSSVVSISWRGFDQQTPIFLGRAVEAENFFSVPVSIMENNIQGILTVYYANGEVHSIETFSQEFSQAYNEIVL